MPWINEFHYDNAGSDTNEFVEIAGDVGTDLTGWSLVLYNGNGGVLYTTTSLTGRSFGSAVNGVGFLQITYPTDGIQNGSPDGFALVNADGQVVEFLSYEGTIAGTSGPAAGQTSLDVGVAEGNSGTNQISLERTGTFSAGQQPTAPGVWAVRTQNSQGALNQGQTIQPQGAVVSVADASIAESDTGATLTFTLTRTGDLSTAFDVQYSTADGTASAPGDYTAVTGGVVSFDVGQTEATITVAVTGDTTFENDETFTVTLSGAPAGVTLADASAVGTIVNDDVRPVPAVSINDVSISEGNAGQTVFTFTVTRTGADGAFSVNFATSDGTATAGEDYVATSGTLNFTAGDDTEVISVTVNGDTAFEPDQTFNITLSDATDGAVITDATGVGTIENDDFTRIYDIQGAGHRSALTGQSVTTRGIVTAVDKNGDAFWLQDAVGDGDFTTSDAVLVYKGSALAADIRVGAEVEVTATVTEYRSTSAARANDLTLTELTAPTVQVLSQDNALPTAVRIGDVNDPSTLQRKPPLVDLGDDETTGVYDAVNDGIDFWESLEGMRVVLEDTRIVSPFESSFGEVIATPNVGFNPSENDRGGLTVRQESPDATNPADAQYDFNPERIQLDDEAGVATPKPTAVGERWGDVAGVVSYEFGFYDVNLTAAPTVTASTIQREVTNISGSLDRVRVASFNVENLAPGDSATKFSGLADAIVTNLKAPEILALQEIQDNNGTTNNGVTDATVTITKLIEAIGATDSNGDGVADGPQYRAILSPPANNQDGGAPGGNIQTGYLYLASAVTPTMRNGLLNADGEPAGPDDLVMYFPSEDRIGVGDPDFAATRKSLPIEWSPAGFTDAEGGSFWTVNNHLSSKGGSAPLMGDQLDLPLYSEPLNGTAVKREGQAIDVFNYISNIVDGGITTDNRVVALGDFNDFQFFPVLELITGELERLTVGDDDTPSTFAETGEQLLYVLSEKLPEDERYSYNFDGNAQALDHILTTSNLYGGASYDIVHINSEFATQLSDHDPSVVSLALERSLALATEGNDVLNQAAYTARFGAERGSLAGADTIRGLGGNDALYGMGGADQLDGGAGDDVLVGGAGDDRLNGSTGNDTADYSDATVGVTVALNILTYQNTGRGSDYLISVENLRGTDFNDQLTGAAGNNRLEGGEGDDTLTGNGGRDTAVYAGADAAVIVDLALSGPQNTFGAGVDTLSTMEDLEGSAFADELSGNGGANTLTGGDGGDRLTGRLGNDSLFGGAGVDTLDGGGGADLLDGGEGIDIATYLTAANRVTVDLGLSGAQNTGGGGVDTLVSIEYLNGSAGFGDLLIGNALANTINGYGGNDTVRGADGDDLLLGWLGDDRLEGGAGDDDLRGGQGKDALFGGTGVDTFVFAALTDSDQDLTDDVDRRDVIGDLASTDVIDLRAIDADRFTAGNQAFTIADSFEGLGGTLVRTFDGENTQVSLYVDGDSTVDMAFVIAGDATEFDNFLL